MDRQTRLLGDVLRATLSGARDEVASLTAEVERLEHDLRSVRDELKHHQLLTDALDRELARRSADPQAPQAEAEAEADRHGASGSCPTEPDAGRQAHTAQSDPELLSPQALASLRGPSRRECAVDELLSTGLTRPVRARDVALRYSSVYDDAQREGARNALVGLVTAGLATRLPDGGYLPTPELISDPGGMGVGGHYVPMARAAEMEAKTAA